VSRSESSAITRVIATSVITTRAVHTAGSARAQLYRELLRSCRRCRAVMRPTHVVIVGECVQKFAVRSPSLTLAVKEHGPLPLPGVQCGSNP
jgi:hypothetical protein